MRGIIILLPSSTFNNVLGAVALMGPYTFGFSLLPPQAEKQGAVLWEILQYEITIFKGGIKIHP